MAWTCSQTKLKYACLVLFLCCLLLFGAALFKFWLATKVASGCYWGHFFQKYENRKILPIHFDNFLFTLHLKKSSQKKTHACSTIVHVEYSVWVSGPLQSRLVLRQKIIKKRFYFYQNFEVQHLNLQTKNKKTNKR